MQPLLSSPQFDDAMDDVRFYLLLCIGPVTEPLR